VRGRGYGSSWSQPVEATKTMAQTLKDRRRLNGMGREKSTVTEVVTMMMLKKRVGRHEIVHDCDNCGDCN
jgi:hypothetical protein